MDTDSKKSTNWIIPQSAYGYDVEAAGVHVNRGNDRAKFWHKVVLMSIITLMSIANLYHVIYKRPEDKSLWSGRRPSSPYSDYTDDRHEKLWVGALIDLSLLVVMVYAILRERYGLLLFSCIISLIEAGWCLARMNRLWEDAPYKREREALAMAIFLVMTVMAIFLNSLIRLTLHVYREKRC